MPFVKLDCGILESTLWFDMEARTVFLTALLMAEPFEAKESMEQLQVRSLDPTGWKLPPGWYGMVPAAGLGIIDRSKIEKELGLDALERLGSQDPHSRSKEFDGRRLVRVDGGYIVLNYIKYRERDYTTAARSKRYREKIKRQASRRGSQSSRRDITQADVYAEVDVEAKNKQQTSSLREVFSYWQTKLNHPQAILTPQRERAIKARLKDGYTVAQMKQAIDGCAGSEWHLGKNGNGVVYDDIGLILRDGKIESFIARIGEHAQPKPPKLQTEREAETWLHGQGHFTEYLKERELVPALTCREFAGRKLGANA